MRILNETEIQQISTRLEALHIQYQETSDEIKDHYYSELEKHPSSDFDEIFEELNKAFSWSLVKKMEKRLQHLTNRQIAKRQWENAKFWNFTPSKLVTFLTAILILSIGNVAWGAAGITLTVAVCALFGLPYIWFAVRDDITLSLTKLETRPSKALPLEIVRRTGFLFGCLSWFGVAVSSFGQESISQLATAITFLVSLPLLLYMITLAQVVWRWKKSQQSTLFQ